MKKGWRGDEKKKEEGRRKSKKIGRKRRGMEKTKVEGRRGGRRWKENEEEV